jgi:tetratricopeptide (TPR) repeat protein
MRFQLLSLLGVLLVLAIGSNPAAAQSGSADAAEALAAAYQRGNQEAAAANDAKAVEAYEEALSYSQSPNLHYNLANSYARLEAWGPAVLHYRKALALDPQFVDARANLLLTQNRAQLPLESASWLRRWAQQLPLTLWAIGLVAAFWIFVAVWLVFRRTFEATRLRWILTLLAIPLAAASVPALYGYHLAGQEGVVIASEATLKVAPTAQSPGAETLPGGTVAQIRKSLNGFFLIETSDGIEGYLPPTEFQPIWDRVLPGN